MSCQRERRSHIALAMRFLAGFLYVVSFSAFGGTTGYFHVDQPLPSDQCASLVWHDCNNGVETDGSACQEVNNRLRALGPAKRTFTTQLKEPTCQRVRPYTAAFLTCSDFLSAAGQIALRKGAADEMSVYPKEIADVRKCMHAVNELNYSVQMTENIKQLFADTETINSPTVANRSTPSSLSITPVSVQTAKEN